MENVKKTELFSYYEQDHNTIHKTRKNLNTLKKTLIELKNPNKPILYFDESRFGTKTGLGWFKKGIRTPIKVKLEFKAPLHPKLYFSGHFWYKFYLFLARFQLC